MSVLSSATPTIEKFFSQAVKDWKKKKKKKKKKNSPIVVIAKVFGVLAALILVPAFLFLLGLILLAILGAEKGVDPEE